MRWFPNWATITTTTMTANKAVYTTAPVADGWAGAVMIWAGAVMVLAGAVLIWAGAVFWVGRGCYAQKSQSRQISRLPKFLVT